MGEYLKVGGAQKARTSQTQAASRDQIKAIQSELIRIGRLPATIKGKSQDDGILGQNTRQALHSLSLNISGIDSTNADSIISKLKKFQKIQNPVDENTFVRERTKSVEITPQAGARAQPQAGAPPPFKASQGVNLAAGSSSLMDARQSLLEIAKKFVSGSTVDVNKLAEEFAAKVGDSAKDNAKNLVWDLYKSLGKNPIEAGSSFEHLQARLNDQSLSGLFSSAKQREAFIRGIGKSALTQNLDQFGSRGSNLTLNQMPPFVDAMKKFALPSERDNVANFVWNVFKYHHADDAQGQALFESDQKNGHVSVPRDYLKALAGSESRVSNSINDFSGLLDRIRRGEAVFGGARLVDADSWTNDAVNSLSGGTDAMRAAGANQANADQQLNKAGNAANSVGSHNVTSSAWSAVTDTAKFAGESAIGVLGSVVGGVFHGTGKAVLATSDAVRNGASDLGEYMFGDRIEDTRVNTELKRNALLNWSLRRFGGADKHLGFAADNIVNAWRGSRATLADLGNAAKFTSYALADVSKSFGNSVSGDLKVRIGLLQASMSQIHHALASLTENDADRKAVLQGKLASVLAEVKEIDPSTAQK